MAVSASASPAVRTACFAEQIEQTKQSHLPLRFGDGDTPGRGARSRRGGVSTKYKETLVPGMLFVM
jgi:hypothetical protein